MNSIAYVLFILFLLSQATKIVNARQLNVNLSPRAVMNDNEKLIPPKAGFEEREHRMTHIGGFAPSRATFEGIENREKRISPLGRFTPSVKENEEREKRRPPLGRVASSFEESEKREKRRPPKGRLIPPNGMLAPSGATFK